MMKKWKGVLAVAGVLAAIVWIWEEVVEDRVLPRRWGVVIPDLLYRSGQLHPSLIERTLRKHHIEVIVDLTAVDPGEAADRREVEVARVLGIRRYVFPLSGDGTGEVTNYIGALKVLWESVQSGKPALVHCAAGSQRTGAAVALYRLLIQGKDETEVLAEMARYDWDSQEDQVLLKYLNRHIGTVAAALAAEGVTDQVTQPLPMLD